MAVNTGSLSWISVTDELPEQGIMVLVYQRADSHPTHPRDAGIFTDMLGKDGEWGDADWLTTHWMPLPPDPAHCAQPASSWAAPTKLIDNPFGRETPEYEAWKQGFLYHLAGLKAHAAPPTLEKAAQEARWAHYLDASDVPGWETLTEVRKAYWRAIARAVIAVYEVPRG